MWDDGEYYDVAFAVGKSRRYHQRFQGFYSGVGFCIDLMQVAVASSLFLLFDAYSPNFAKVFAAIIALLSILSLIIRFSDLGKTHANLYARFTELAAKIETWDETPENLRKAKSERLKIERDEPPPRRIIDILSENEEARSRGVDESELHRLSRMQRTFGYIVTYGLP